MGSKEKNRPPGFQRAMDFLEQQLAVLHVVNRICDVNQVVGFRRHVQFFGTRNNTFHFYAVLLGDFLPRLHHPGRNVRHRHARALERKIY